MSFIILKHIISLEITFLEFSDLSFGVLVLYSLDWRFEIVEVLLVTSSSILTDQFLHSCKLSFNHFSFVFF